MHSHATTHTTSKEEASPKVAVRVGRDPGSDPTQVTGSENMRIPPCHQEDVAAVISLGPRAHTVGVYRVGCLGCLLLALLLSLLVPASCSLLPTAFLAAICWLGRGCHGAIVAAAVARANTDAPALLDLCG